MSDDDKNNEAIERLKTWSSDDVKKVELHIHISEDIQSAVTAHKKKLAVREFAGSIKYAVSWLAVIIGGWIIAKDFIIEFIKTLGAS